MAFLHLVIISYILYKTAVWQDGHALIGSIMDSIK